MKTTNLQYYIVIRKEKNLYIADAPVLGISDYGKTKTEVKKNITNAIQCHIDGLMKNNEYKIYN